MKDVKPDRILLGREIARTREHVGLSPFDLGVATGVPEAEIRAYEAGQRPISTARLRAIALACNTSSAKLLEHSLPAPVVPNTPQWRALGTLFAQMSEAARDALVRHAQHLLQEDEGR